LRLPDEPQLLDGPVRVATAAAATKVAGSGCCPLCR
jgi:hypothetical protein